MRITGPAKWYNPGGFLGQAGEFKNFLGTKEGAIFSGRAVKEGGAKDRDMGGAHIMDAFVSPATTGTSQQTSARIPAALLALYFGGAALGGSAAAGGTSGGGGVAAGGAAPTAGAAPVSGATSGGAASSGGGMASSGSFPLTRMAMNMTRGQQQRPQQPQQQPQPFDPYGLNASGLPADAWQDPRMQVMQALLEQQAMND